MRTRICFLILCGLTAAASASPSGSGSVELERETGIIGGTAANGDPAVVFLAGFPADRSTMFTCTAIIVSPTAALTAAHCVDHADYTFGVFLGADASGTLAELEPQLVPISAVHPHPEYSREPPFTADIAVIEFATPVSITPLAISRTPPIEAMVGLSVRIVGYGQTVYEQPNSRKFAGTTVIAGLDPDDTILIGDTNVRTCIGDSGGPVLLDNIVLGVNSYSDTTGCNDPAHFRRTDAYLSFIDDLAGTMPVPPPPPDDDPPPDDEPGGGGCSTTHSPPWLLALLGLLLLRRR